MRALLCLVLLAALPVGGCTCDGDPGRPRTRFNVGTTAKAPPDAARAP